MDCRVKPGNDLGNHRTENALKSEQGVIRLGETAMRATVQKKRLKLFHATVVVTRVEEWCVEAQSAQEARELLASGNGHRCDLGDCLHVELDRLEDSR